MQNIQMQIFLNLILYIEKDYGNSFPKKYIWLQDNTNKNSSIFFSRIYNIIYIFYVIYIYIVVSNGSTMRVKVCKHFANIRKQSNL